VDGPAGVLYLDQDGWVTWADTDAAELLRWSVEELVGRPVGEVLGGDAPSVERLNALLRQDPPSGACELRVWRSTGGWAWLRAAVSDQTHPAFGGLRVVLFDVSRRRWLDDARALMLESMVEAMWVADQAGDVIVANTAAARLLGMSPEFFVGLLPAELLTRFRSAEGRPLTWLGQPVEYCLLGEATDAEELVSYRHPDGTDRWFLLRVALRARDGEPRAVVTLFDLTDPVSLRAHLERVPEKS
jgi:PAS domain S-box-containing protein